VQGFAVGCALLPVLDNAWWVADVLLWASVALALVSGGQYALDGSRAATAMARDGHDS
jgi:hypothetical protein